jgi:hypothetical protein
LIEDLTTRPTNIALVQEEKPMTDEMEIQESGEAQEEVSEVTAEDFIRRFSIS